MATSRRNFLEGLVGAGVLTSAFASTAEARALVDSLFDSVDRAASEPQTGSDVHTFWNNFFDSVGPNSRGSRPLEAADRKVQYLHFKEGQGLRYLGDVKQDELMDYDGDVMVTATLGQYRPSVEDQQMLESVRSSSLRVDFVQTQSFMNILAPMAWAALAVFEHSKASKLPSVSQLGYQKNFMDGKILLPGGTGKFALNVYPVKPESMLHKIMKIAIPAALAVAPVLNFPAISIPVLKTITQIYLGPKEEENYGKPLLNSLPVRWNATQRAFAESLEAEKFPLIDGSYIMVPQAHTEELGKAIPTLDLQQGYLVSKDASKTDSPETRFLQTVPDVTYVTMSLKVTKPAPSTTIAKPTADAVEATPDAGTKPEPKSTVPPKKKP